MKLMLQDVRLRKHVEARMIYRCYLLRNTVRFVLYLVRGDFRSVITLNLLTVSIVVISLYTVLLTCFKAWMNDVTKGHQQYFYFCFMLSDLINKWIIIIIEIEIFIQQIGSKTDQ